jgi:uncharacterized protein (DUF433 family)
MPVRVIDAKQALEDIRAGMDDNALMQKYRISPFHLEQLFSKLETLHVLKRLHAGTLLKDMRAGLTDANLMAKYRLSASALQHVLAEMVRNGLSLQASPLPRVREKRRISAKEIVGDIRSGMTARQLMQKHALSAKGLRRVFHKLLESGWVVENEFAEVPADEDISVIVQKMRKATRRHPVLSVTLYEKAKPQVRGLLRDLSESGLGVSGIRAKVGEMRTLVLVPDESLPVAPFAVHATCRWFKEGEAGSHCSAGFEITHAELSSLEALRDLIEEVTLTFEG